MKCAVCPWQVALTHFKSSLLERAREGGEDQYADNQLAEQFRILLTYSKTSRVGKLRLQSACKESLKFCSSPEEILENLGLSDPLVEQLFSCEAVAAAEKQLIYRHLASLLEELSEYFVAYDNWKVQLPQKYGPNWLSRIVSFLKRRYPGHREFFFLSQLVETISFAPDLLNEIFLTCGWAKAWITTYPHEEPGELPILADTLSELEWYVRLPS